MSKDNVNPVMILLSIVKRGKGNKLMTVLAKNNILMHMQAVGYGTAPSEMMDILGLSTSDKDIVISLGSESEVKKLMNQFGEYFESHSEYGGLMMVLSINAINRLTAKIIERNLSEDVEKGDVVMQNEHKHNLILITVAQGYTDQVMTAAKKKGATGGTVIRARLAETERLKELANIDIEEEREIIAILAPANITNEILEEANKEFGLRTKAKGIMCSIPVDKAYKI